MSEQQNRNYGQNQYSVLNYGGTAMPQQANVNSCMTIDDYRYEQRQILKYNLRMKEIQYRDSLKKKTYEISCVNDRIQLNAIVVFDCSVKGINKYVRDDSQQNLFQIVIVSNGKERKSELYDTDLLSSSTKLKKTILHNYDTMRVGTQESTAAWKWILGKCCKMYDEAETLQLPDSPGWKYCRESIKFYAGNRMKGLDIYKNQRIKQFQLRYVKYDVCKIRQMIERNKDDIASVLLNVRLIALLGDLCEGLIMHKFILLYGSRSLQMARDLLSVSSNGYNIINLDSDRLNETRNKIKIMKNDVAIFNVNNASNRSAVNRIKEIYSWKQSGYIEGHSIKIPFVICMSKLSFEIPLSECIVVDTDRVNKSELELLFDSIQSWVIDEIEESGVMIEKLFEKEQKDAEETPKTIYQIVSEVIGRVLVEDSAELIDFLKKGQQEMLRQEGMQHGRLLDVFHSAVLSCKQLVYQDRRKTERLDDAVMVLYDDDYYYFQSTVIDTLCKTNNIDLKILCMIKQELAQQGFIKMYRSNGNHNREFQTDIAITQNGDKLYRSVLAVKRDFWDETYGLTLYERR